MNLIAQIPANPRHLAEYLFLGDAQAPLQAKPHAIELRRPHDLPHHLPLSYVSPLCLTHVILVDQTHPAHALEPSGTHPRDFERRAGFACSLPATNLGWESLLARAGFPPSGNCASFLFWQMDIDLRGSPLRDRVKQTLQALVAQTTQEASILSRKAHETGLYVDAFLSSLGVRS